MPRGKKHQKKHQNFGSADIHASSSSTSPTKTQKSDKSVNEKLAQLRREAAPAPTVDAINQIQAVASTPTQPPAIRGILGLPETAPLRPRPSRRGPGYRAQAYSSVFSTSSFQSASHGHLKPVMAPVHESDARQLPLDFSNLAKVTEGFEKLPNELSLKHFCLKQMARTWPIFSIVEEENIYNLTPANRSTLLLYISLYGPDTGLDKSLLKLLFPFDHQKHVTRLDMNGFLSSDFNFADFCRFVTKVPKSKASNSGSPTEQDPDAEVTSTKGKDKGKAREDISPEELSWEEQIDAQLQISGLYLRPISQKPFCNLSHLGLGNPGRFASWTELLALAPKLTQITHLSLAYWPMPCFTPHFDTQARLTLMFPEEEKLLAMKFDNAHRVIARIIHDYFAQRVDTIKEAAAVLKHLSEHWYRLEYLDLEGCHDWLPALVWKDWGGLGNLEALQPTSNSWASDYMHTLYYSAFEPALKQNWGALKHIDVRQSSAIPQDLTSVVSKMPPDLVTAELFPDISENMWATSNLVGVTEKDIEMIKWVEIERQIHLVCTRIRKLRIQARMKPIHCENGLKTNQEVTIIMT
jgi:hypothetical protein